MRFPFIVKHNGVVYPAGKEVPIGKEPKVENQIEDKTASELSKELEERFGIKMPAQKGKKALLAALKEAEEIAKLESEEDEDLEEDPEGEGEPNEDEDLEDGDLEGEGSEDDLLTQIVNE